MNYSVSHPGTPSLRDLLGHRKYLNAVERDLFRDAADRLKLTHCAFCNLLLESGCRISEALTLTADRVELTEGVIVIETLKQRRKGVYRVVPVSDFLLIHLSQLEPDSETGRLWTFSRSTGYRIIKHVMKEAGIEGAHACPKALRHSFGVICAKSNIQLGDIQSMLGHSNTANTMIYLNFHGNDIRELLKPLWPEGAS